MLQGVYQNEIDAYNGAIRLAKLTNKLVGIRKKSADHYLWTFEVHSLVNGTDAAAQGMEMTISPYHTKTSLGYEIKTNTALFYPHTLRRRDTHRNVWVRKIGQVR